MYKKAIGLLVTGNLFMLLACILVPALGGADGAKKEVCQVRMELLKLEEIEIPEYISRGSGNVESAVSGQRIVDYAVLEQTDSIKLSNEELEVLLKIVEAEAGCEDEDGKLLVANVVLNRVKNESFPSTIKEVVFQQDKGVSQFSPVSNGRYDTVTVSEETINAVTRALSGEDISQGALYFAARKYADTDKMKWFDDNLIFLFCYGRHEFFK